MLTALTPCGERRCLHAHRACILCGSMRSRCAQMYETFCANPIHVAHEYSPCGNEAFKAEYKRLVEMTEKPASRIDRAAYRSFMHG